MPVEVAERLHDRSGSKKQMDSAPDKRRGHRVAIQEAPGIPVHLISRKSSITLRYQTLASTSPKGYMATQAVRTHQVSGIPDQWIGDVI